MEKRALSEEIITIEREALQAWLNGDPTPYLELYSKDFTYFDPVQDKRIDGWDAINKFYESMRGLAKTDRFEIIDPVVQATDAMAVLTYNLRTYTSETFCKENCTEVYRLEEDHKWHIVHSHWSLTNAFSVTE